MHALFQQGRFVDHNPLHPAFVFRTGFPDIGFHYETIFGYIALTCFKTTYDFCPCCVARSYLHRLRAINAAIFLHENNIIAFHALDRFGF